MKLNICKHTFVTYPDKCDKCGLTMEQCERQYEAAISEAKGHMMRIRGEMMDKRKSINDNHKCLCGHKRANHAPSANINYTGGHCHKCRECRYFEMKGGDKNE